MKVNKSLQSNPALDRKSVAGNKMLRNFIVISVCALLAVSLSAGFRYIEDDDHSRVYASSGTADQDDASAEGTADTSESLSVSIAEIVSGALSMNSEGTYVRRIGTSCEKVMVGQRVKLVEGQASRLSISESMETSVNLLDSAVTEQAKSAKLMSDTDYETLQRIVEAEAGTEDLKGKILVANVILNRVKSEGFPDTVTEVVWDQSYGVVQFSPTQDGRISEVTVTEETKEAVKQALEGVDYSEGALFFIERKAASKSNVEWFEKELEYLFKYGVHEFYTYPEDSSQTSGQEKTDSSGQQEEAAGEEETAGEEENIVQMVKNE